MHQSHSITASSGHALSRAGAPCMQPVYVGLPLRAEASNAVYWFSKITYSSVCGSTSCICRCNMRAGLKSVAVLIPISSLIRTCIPKLGQFLKLHFRLWFISLESLVLMFFKMPVQRHGAAEEFPAAMRTLVCRLPFHVLSSIIIFALGRQPQ